MEEFLLVDDNFCGNCSNSLSSTDITSTNSSKIYNLDIVVHTVKENKALGVACEKVSVFTAIKDLLSCQFQTSETDRVTADGVNYSDNDHLNSTNKIDEHSSNVNVQVPLCLPCSLLLQDLYRSFKLFQNLRDGASYISKLTHRLQQTFSISDVRNIGQDDSDTGIQFGEYQNNESEVQTFEDPFGEDIDVKINAISMATGASPSPAEGIVDAGIVENASSFASNDIPLATGTSAEIKTEVEPIPENDFALSVSTQEGMIQAAISDIAAEEVDPLGLIECEENSTVNPFTQTTPTTSAMHPSNSVQAKSKRGNKKNIDDSNFNTPRRSRRFQSKPITNSKQRTKLNGNNISSQTTEDIKTEMEFVSSRNQEVTMEAANMEISGQQVDLQSSTQYECSSYFTATPAASSTAATPAPSTSSYLSTRESAIWTVSEAEEDRNYSDEMEVAWEAVPSQSNSDSQIMRPENNITILNTFTVNEMSQNSGSSPNTGPTRKTYKCGFCNFTTFQSHSYTTHRENDCAFSPTTPKNNANVMMGPQGENENLKQLTTQRRKIVKCRYCNFRSVRYSVITHERLHTGERPFTCPLPGCSFRAAHSTNVTQHIKSKHSDNSHFPCNLCLHTGKNLLELKSHQLLCHPELLPV